MAEMTEKVEETTEEVPVEEKTEEVQEKTEEKTEEKEEKPKNKIPARNRISQLTKNWREEQRERERLQAEVEQLRKQNIPAKKPSEDDYESYEAYAKDRDAYNSAQEQRIREDERKKFQQEQEEQNLQRERAKIAEDWAKKKNKAIKKYENFVQSEQEVLGIIQDFHAIDMQECILESKVGDAMVDYLGSNLDEAEEIAQLPPRAQARALLRLENSLDVKPSKKTSPPEPIKPVGTGSAKLKKNLNDMSQAEYNEYMNNRQR